MFWSRRSKRISLCRTWSKHKCFGRADRNVSGWVELGRNIDVLVAPVETYLAWSNLVETQMFWSRRSKRISHGRNWSEPRCFGRAGRNVSRMVELGRNLDVLVSGSIRIPLGRLGRNIEVCGRADRNISRLVKLGRNLDVLVAQVETYLALSNLVET